MTTLQTDGKGTKKLMSFFEAAGSNPVNALQSILEVYYATLEKQEQARDLSKDGNAYRPGPDLMDTIAKKLDVMVTRFLCILVSK